MDEVLGNQLDETFIRISEAIREVKNSPRFFGENEAEKMAHWWNELIDEMELVLRLFCPRHTEQFIETGVEIHGDLETYESMIADVFALRRTRNFTPSDREAFGPRTRDLKLRMTNYLNARRRALEEAR